MKGRDWGVMAALLSTAILTVGAFYPRGKVAALSSVGSIPMDVGSWKGRDVPVDERTYELLETRNVLMREYQSPDKAPVVLCIVFSRDNRKVSHPPEVCYQGDGFEIAASGNRPQLAEWKGRALRANLFTAERRGERQAVLYWYKAGEDYTASYYQQQWRAIWAQALRKKSGCALIRLSAPAGKDGGGAAELTDFARQILPILDKELI